MRSPWAAKLADLIGLDSTALVREAVRAFRPKPTRDGGCLEGRRDHHGKFACHLARHRLPADGSRVMLMAQRLKWRANVDRVDRVRILRGLS